MDKIAVTDSIARDRAAAEAIDALRANLMFCGERARVVGITSFGAAEGRADISFQLAASLAKNKKSVLLIDADLRRRSLQARLGVDGTIDGLGEYLTGRADMEAVVKQTDVPGLFVIFAGFDAADEPAELLGGERFGGLISQLRGVLDYIIVDTPSMERAIDCAAAAPVLDGVLVVVDAVNSSGKQQRRIKNRLERAGGRILGVVLERVDAGGSNSDARARVGGLVRQLRGGRE